MLQKYSKSTLKNTLVEYLKKYSRVYSGVQIIVIKKYSVIRVRVLPRFASNIHFDSMPPDFLSINKKQNILKFQCMKKNHRERCKNRHT